jgi:glutathione S-transferase
MGRDGAGARRAGGCTGEITWLAGNEFTVADLNVAAALYRGLFLDLARWPTVTAWLQRCWDRPAAKRARAMRE